MGFSVADNSAAGFSPDPAMVEELNRRVLEMERAGDLSTERQAMIAELRNRGILAPAADRVIGPGGLRVDNTGQVRFGATPEQIEGLRTRAREEIAGSPAVPNVGPSTRAVAADVLTTPIVPDIGTGVASGVTRMARGVATLPTDIVGADDTSDAIAKFIPQISTEGGAQELTAVLTQYGLPASAAARAVSGLVKGLGPVTQWFSKLLAGGAADVAAAGSKDGTIGDMVGGPTRTTPEDTPLERRVKVGAEGVAVPGAIDAALKGVTGAGRGLGTMLGREKNVTDLVAENLQSSAIDKDAAIAELQQIIRDMDAAGGGNLSPGFRPTTGTASNDPGLIGTERGIVTSAPASAQFRARANQNARALSEDVNTVTQDVVDAGAPDAATAAFRSQNEAVLGRPQARLIAAERGKAITDIEVENELAAFAGLNRGRQLDASAVIDDAVRQRLNAVTNERKALYRAIDPDYSVEVPKQGIDDALNKATFKRSPGDNAPDKLPPDLVADMRAALDSDEVLTFGALQDFRPRLSEATAAARAANRGDVVERLTDIQKAIAAEAKALEAAGTEAATRARTANKFHQDTYVPLFKTSTGDAFRKAERRGAPIAPSMTGARFLRASAGPSESAAQLKSILDGAPNAPQARAAVREHVLADVVDFMRTTDGRIARDRLNAYLGRREVREVLDQFPDVKDEILTFRNNLGGKLEAQSRFAEDVKARSADLSRSEKYLNQSATRFFIDRDPISAMEGVFRSDNPAQAMSDLMMRAKADRSGAAVAGLRSAFADYLQKNIRGTTEVGGEIQILQSQITNFLDNPKNRRALGVIYDPTEIRTLERVRDQIRLARRIDQQVTTGLPTASLGQEARRAQTFLFSLYGIVRGRGIFMLGRLLQRLSGRDPELIAQRLVTDAMLDPKLGRDLLMRDTLANRKKLEQRIVTWAADNLISSDGEQDQNQ